MKKDKRKSVHPVIGGIITGLLSGLLGAGGGMIAVPFLTRRLDHKRAHATCVAVMLVICFSGAISYLSVGAVSIDDVMPLLPWGILGALIGSFLLKRLSNKLIRKIFAIFMLWAGLRLIFR